MTDSELDVGSLGNSSSVQMSIILLENFSSETISEMSFLGSKDVINITLTC